jgi:recombination endonuclease VII
MKTSPEKLAYAKAYREKHREALRLKAQARRPIRTVQRQAWNAANRDKQRAVNERVHLQRYHGLTVEQHQAMLVAQRGICAICGRAPGGKAHCAKLHVDHDHTTGTIRDLLCADCNMGLGKFADSPTRLLKAAWYLERHAKTRHTA